MSLENDSTLVVAIDARVPDVAVGGVQKVISKIADDFRILEPRALQRIWLVYSGTKWWKSYIPKNDTILTFRPPLGNIGIFLGAKFPNFISRLLPLVSLILRRGHSSIDAKLQQLGVKVVHKPFQDSLTTSLPSIYHPHDLQHFYFPEFFTSAQIRHRNSVWRNHAVGASVVIAENLLVRDDLVRYWGIPSEKITILPTPPLIQEFLCDEKKDAVPDYIIYPAAFWPHKNHTNLIMGISVLHSRGLKLRLVLTGSPVGDFNSVVSLISELGLSDHVSLLGHVDDKHLHCLLMRATLLVLPSLFESFSLPIWEAQALGVPVACSRIGALPLQVGDSAELFDPHDPLDIADKIEQLIKDEDRRRLLGEKGYLRTRSFKPGLFGLALSSVYRRLANFPIIGEEEIAFSRLQNFATSSESTTSSNEAQ